MEPQQVRTVVRRWGAVGLLTALLGALVAYTVSRMQPQLYVAEGRVHVQVAANTPNPSDVVNTDAALMTQVPLLQKVITQLHLDERPESLQARVQVSPQPGTQILGVSVSDTNAVRSASIANALMNEFAGEVGSPAISPSSGALRQRITTLQDRLRGAESARDQAVTAHQDTSALDEEIAEATGELGLINDQLRAQGQASPSTTSVTVVSPATVPPAPTLPRIRLNTVIGGVVGLLLGLMLVALRTSLDPRLRDEDDVRSRLDLPTLGVIPSFGGAQRSAHGRRHLEELAVAGEAYRRLRTNLLCRAQEAPLKSVLVTSARVGEGKTRTAANLAGVVAALGQRVLLVDADLRRPGQAALFGGTADRGLADVLEGIDGGAPGRRRGTGTAVSARPTDFPNLELMPAGPPPPNPAELLASPRLPEVLSRLERDHDLVVVDSSSVGTYSDALVLARHASGTILVVEAGRTSVDDVRRAVDSLSTVGARVLGIVINRGQTPLAAGTPDLTATARRVSPGRSRSWVPRAQVTR